MSITQEVRPAAVSVSQVVGNPITEEFVTVVLNGVFVFRMKS